MKRKVIISVSNKTGLAEFAKDLVALNFEVLSTGGTAKHLQENGIPVTAIDTYTGHPEILEGRVKSLHPKIHGGILARQDRADDMEDLKRCGIDPVHMVVVNLYPFHQAAAAAVKSGSSDSLVEEIDIGGPTLIRAAAKNCHFVIPVCNPNDYANVLEKLHTSGEVDIPFRRELAAKVFAMMSAYDAAIARYFSLGEHLCDEQGSPVPLAPREAIVLERIMPLRYGENPHQHAALYRTADGMNHPCWKQLQGKELSYNNLLDMFATLDLFCEIYRDRGKQECAVVIKHTNPCGVALRATNHEAFLAARACDPVSAFGGIIAVSGVLDEKLAESITEGFVEVLLASEISAQAAAVIERKKNLRLIHVDFEEYIRRQAGGIISVRNSGQDFLLQSGDTVLASVKDARVVTKEKPDTQLLQDLELAWKVCKHVKSNAIVIVKDQQAVGIGAGQMSRVDSAKIALSRAALHGHNVKDSVAASDAFLPFSDTLEFLNDGGVRALVQPGGSLKDSEVIAEAERRNMVMVCTGERHFRH